MKSSCVVSVSQDIIADLGFEKLLLLIKSLIN